MLIAKDGRTQDVPSEQYFYWLGRGWTITDPLAPVPPVKIVSNITANSSGGGYTVKYVDGTTAQLAGSTGGTGGAVTGVKIDTDGRPYFSAGGTAPVAIDTDGRPYFPGV